MFNETFNSILGIVAPSFTEYPDKSQWPIDFIKQMCIKYTSPWVGIKLTT